MIIFGGTCVSSFFYGGLALAENNLNKSRLRLYGLIFLLIIFYSSVFTLSLSLENTGFGTSVIFTLFSAALSAGTILVFRKEGFAAPKTGLVLPLIPVFLAFILRLCLFEHITLDYEDFLSPWIDRMRAGGGLSALKDPIGNYNIPYLVYLGIISGLPIYDLYLIKLLSVLFDFILALYLMRLVSCFTDSKIKRYVCLAAALFLPTPVLNGALWGQCDSIYTAFAVMGLYYGIKRKPVLSMVCAALSFSFKLQAIFILPVYFLFMLSGRIRLRHLPIFPLTYFIAVSPAIIAGRPVLDTLTIYFSELSTVGSGLNYNSPSVYSLFRNFSDPELASGLGILAALSLCIIVFAAAVIRRRGISDRTLLSAALVFAAGLPLLLPHMHDRYFFIADVLTLAFAAVFPAFIHTVPLTSFASLLGYHAYLKMRYLLPMRYGFTALLIVLASLLYFYFGSFSYIYAGAEEDT